MCINRAFSIVFLCRYLVKSNVAGPMYCGRQNEDSDTWKIRRGMAFSASVFSIYSTSNKIEMIHNWPEDK